MSAATALNNACSVSNITEGLEPLHMLNQEISNRWQVMGAVVSRRKKVIDSTLKQMKHYKEVVEKVDETLTRPDLFIPSPSCPEGSHTFTPNAKYCHERYNYCPSYS